MGGAVVETVGDNLLVVVPPPAASCPSRLLLQMTLCCNTNVGGKERLIINAIYISYTFCTIVYVPNMKLLSTPEIYSKDMKAV